MPFIEVTAILLFAFGTLSYGALGISWLQARNQNTTESPVDLFLTFYAAAWFLVNLVSVFGSFYSTNVGLAIEVVILDMALLWPAVMMHAFYSGCTENWNLGLIAPGLAGDSVPRKPFNISSPAYRAPQPRISSFITQRINYPTSSGRRRILHSEIHRPPPSTSSRYRFG